jgi:hypothetical protein
MRSGLQRPCLRAKAERKGFSAEDEPSSGEEPVSRTAYEPQTPICELMFARAVVVMQVVPVGQTSSSRLQSCSHVGLAE